MRYLIFRLLFFVSFLFSGTSLSGLESENIPVQDTILYASPFKKDNERCFICHGQERYEYTDETSGRRIKAAMDRGKILSIQEFYGSNHKSFSCTDCHSSGYLSFPHPEKLKDEPQFNCLDCHGGDPSYTEFKFEEIDTEYRKSVHFKLEEKGFNCWQCHDPHSYRLMARNSKDLKEIVLYDNDICLDCHSDYDRFQLFSDRDKIKLNRVHKWLPHQNTHFKSVRCIDCHTKINENLLVSHFVVPEEGAVRNCRKCHSDESSAMTSLLKTIPKTKRNEELKNTFISGLNIIGPNRNKFLDNISMMILTVVMAIIAIHLLFRVIRK